MRLKIFLLVLAVLAASAQEVEEQNAEPAEGLEVEDDIEKRDVPELEGFGEEDDRERRDAPEEEEDDKERRDAPETEDFDEEVSDVVKRASGPPSVDSMANDFEKGLGSWWQEKSDKFDWTRHKGSTTSSQTGPSGDHTSGSGYYLYIETSYPRVKGDVAKLKFKGMTKASSVCMSLYYHMYGSAMGTLNIYNNNKKIFTKSGNQGNSWHKAELDLPGPFIDIVIEGITGSSYTSDIAIDDISIAKRACNAPTPSQPPPPPPQPGQCGVSPMSRVIGGVDAKPGSWPWQIGLHRSGRFICGGSLIHRQWIVTAAHCVTQSSPSLYTIRLGDHNRNVNEGTEEEIKAIRVISHPNYNNPRLNNDIALIQLARPATLNSHVGLVCLPDQDYVLPAGSNCYITGWGKIKHPGGSHHILQQAQMPPVTLAECKKKNGNIGIQVNDNMICATKRNTIISGCHGDSGGPYVCKNSAGRWVLQGDVSWGSSSCNINQLYTVFGRVAKFRNWINSYIGAVPTAPPSPPPPSTPPSPPPPSTPPTPPLPGSCGSKPSMTRIVGGTQAKVHAWPWQTMLTSSSGRQFCGGSLVHPQFVVTAAHCIVRQTPSTMKVKLGAHYRVSGSTGKEQIINVAQIFAHPQYHKPKQYSNDIAVLKLARPAVLNNAVGTVCMPDGKFPLPFDDLNKKCFITGWGTLASGGSQPNALMQASVPLVSNKRCNAPAAYGGKIHDSMLCAGLDAGGVDACQGDSGGPLVCEFNGRWYLEGATSWGYGCARPNKYGVYALVRYNQKWVETIVQTGAPPPTTPPPTVAPGDMSTDFTTFGNWQQDKSDKFDWTLRSGGTPSSSTGPSGDVSGSGKYAYIETSSPRVNGDNAKLVFRGSYSGAMCMTFFYHMYGSTINTLRVFSNNIKVFEKTGNQGNVWYNTSVTLNGNTNVVIEAVAGSSYTGDIAIDNISVVKRACGSQPTPPPPSTPPTPATTTPLPLSNSLDTNFDNLGNWKQDTSDNFDWTLRSGSTPSLATGPTNGQGGSGNYAYIETSSPRKEGDKARLVFRGSYSGDMCMNFFYHMYGATINTLRVFSNNKEVFAKNGTQGNAWKKATVTLNGNTNVVIEAVAGSSYTGDIAIDSITSVKGACGCPNVTPSPPLPTVPPTIPPGMTTDFEKNLGLWQQDRNDKFDWTRRSGGTPSYNTGPSSGQGGSGYYVYIETSSPRVNGDKASLVFRGSYSGAMCMTFYYHMYGATINTLRVLSNNNLVFTKNGQQGNSWKKASVTLNGNKNVVIEAVSGSSYTGDIAIDSISVALGKCAVSTPPPPPTGSPPPPGSCGRKPAMSRIVGGKPAKPHDWPWQAMLTTTSGFAFCGGSLVHPQYVVTATHCVTGKSPSSIRIKLGAHYRVSGSTGKEQTINVAQIFTHPQYHKPKRYSNDIAVLKLARPAVLNNAVGTVCMPDKSIPLPFDDLNKKCFITGWGTLASGGSRPNALMQASVPLVSNKRCNAPAAYGGKIGDSMLCAGLDAGGVDACQGDSGGPLVCEFNGRWYLEGATSWGYGCARPNKYGVYALVRYNLNWVQQKINGV